MLERTKDNVVIFWRSRPDRNALSITTLNLARYLSCEILTKTGEADVKELFNEWPLRRLRPKLFIEKYNMNLVAIHSTVRVAAHTAPVKNIYCFNSADLVVWPSCF